MAGFNGQAFSPPAFAEGNFLQKGQGFRAADDFSEGNFQQQGSVFYRLLGPSAPLVVITAPGGSPVADNAVIRVDVTDDLVGFSVSVFLEGGGYREAVFSTANGFGPDYQNVLNQHTAITGGRRIEFNRDGGWVHGSAIARAVVIDVDGTTASDSESFTFL